MATRVRLDTLLQDQAQGAGALSGNAAPLRWRDWIPPAAAGDVEFRSLRAWRMTALRRQEAPEGELKQDGRKDPAVEPKSRLGRNFVSWVHGPESL